MPYALVNEAQDAPARRYLEKAPCVESLANRLQAQSAMTDFIGEVPVLMTASLSALCMRRIYGPCAGGNARHLAARP